MPVINLVDEFGYGMKLMEIDGYCVCTDETAPNQEQELQTIKQWSSKSNDLMICAYPKSGTHWVYEAAYMLMADHASRVNFVKEKAMVEIMSQESYNELKEPRVFNSHMYFYHLPEDFIKKKCKVIYILRNPKDVAVSFFNHHSKIREYEYEGDWDSYLPRFIKGQVDFGSWFDYTLHWEKVIQENRDYPIHVVTYEDLKQDALREITRIAKFLGVNSDLEFLKTVTEQCDFHKMKKEKNILEESTIWKDGIPGMYRKGEIGDWKNWFTVAQNEMFDRVYEEKMKNSKLTFRYS